MDFQQRQQKKYSALLDQLECWHEQGDYEKIIARILEIDEWQYQYILVSQAARAYNNLGSYQKALELLMTVKEQGTEDCLWFYRLGYAYFYLNKRKEAATCFEKVLEFDADDTDALFYLLHCYEEEDEQEKWQAAADRLRESAPEEWAEYIEAGGENPEPRELYTEEEIMVLEEHISKYFGSFQGVFHELVSPDIHVDIAIIEPSNTHNYYTLVTMGMGAHKMNVPKDMKDKSMDRAELMLCLPPDWDIKNPDETWYWPLRWLKILARLPIEENSWLGWGHTVPNGEPFANNTKLSAVALLHPAWVFSEEAAQCRMPNGDIISFYQVVPLYEEEMNFKIMQGMYDFLELVDDNFLPVIDINRKNYCDFFENSTYLPTVPEIKELIQWDGPAGCIVSDKILLEGCQVGYMYREEPIDNVPDSGWRFFAQEEISEQVDDMEHIHVSDLNTVCNYDQDIIPFLDAPVGTVFYRDSTGSFRKK